MLIGLTGKAGVGKSTVTNLLLDFHGYFDLAFADSLKKAAREIFGLPLSYFRDQDLKEVVDPFWNMSPRKMLQLLGTDACRNNIDQDIWVKSLLRAFYKLTDDFSEPINVVVSDIRFENEATAIRNAGGIVVHVVASRASGLSDELQNHASESGVKFITGDWILNNRGTQEELPAELAKLLTAIGELNA